MNSKLRDELIQVAAVAIAIITDLDQGNTTIVKEVEDSDGIYRITTAHSNALSEVIAERHEQERKWGARHHDIYKWLAILGEEVGEANQAALEGEEG